MIFTKLIIKNYLPRATNYYMAIYNKQSNIIHKLKFHTSLGTPTFWQDVKVPSYVLIINSFLLFFTIVLPHPTFHS